MVNVVFINSSFNYQKHSIVEKIDIFYCGKMNGKYRLYNDTINLLQFRHQIISD